jgi:hypothetical protein
MIFTQKERIFIFKREYTRYASAVAGRCFSFIFDTKDVQIFLQHYILKILNIFAMPGTLFLFIFIYFPTIQYIQYSSSICSTVGCSY